MRTKDQETLDKIMKFVNKYYRDNRIAPTISEVASGVGVARSTTHRYLQELSDRDLLDYGRGILSAPESAKMKTAYVTAPLVGSIYCGSPEEEEEKVELLPAVNSFPGKSKSAICHAYTGCSSSVSSMARCRKSANFSPEQISSPYIGEIIITPPIHCVALISSFNGKYARTLSLSSNSTTYLE